MQLPSPPSPVFPMCVRMHEDDDSIGHHFSIFMVALLSFSTLVCVTVILLYVVFFFP